MQGRKGSGRPLKVLGSSLGIPMASPGVLGSPLGGPWEDLGNPINIIIGILITIVSASSIITVAVLAQVLDPIAILAQVLDRIPRL